MSNPNLAFELRIRTAPTAGYGTTISIRAYDDLGWDSAGRVKLTVDLGWDSAGRVKLTVEVRHGSTVVFPKGQLTCALHGSSDGTAAKELVMWLGDTRRFSRAIRGPRVCTDRILMSAPGGADGGGILVTRW